MKWFGQKWLAVNGGVRKKLKAAVKVAQKAYLAAVKAGVELVVPADGVTAATAKRLGMPGRTVRNHVCGHLATQRVRHATCMCASRVVVHVYATQRVRHATFACAPRRTNNNALTMFP